MEEVLIQICSSSTSWHVKIILLDILWHSFLDLKFIELEIRCAKERKKERLYTEFSIVGLRVLWIKSIGIKKESQLQFLHSQNININHENFSSMSLEELPLKELKKEDWKRKPKSFKIEWDCSNFLCKKRGRIADYIL